MDPLLLRPYNLTLIVEGVILFSPIYMALLLLLTGGITKLAYTWPGKTHWYQRILLNDFLLFLPCINSKVVPALFQALPSSFWHVCHGIGYLQSTSLYLVSNSWINCSFLLLPSRQIRYMLSAQLKIPKILEIGFPNFILRVRAPRFKSKSLT